MISLSATQVAQATGGRLVGVQNAESVVISSVTTDSREVTHGTLFVAKPGEATDGHKFVPQAAQAGAVLNLLEREVTNDAGSLTPVWSCPTSSRPWALSRAT